MTPKRIEIVETVSQRHLADELMADGRAVVVDRGRPRSLVLNCPDDCGSVLTVNLDPAAGKAWTLYNVAGRTFSLYPSVWRNDGCRAHFIIWKSTLYLFGRDALDLPESASLCAQILDELRREPAPVLRLAALLDEDAWYVATACERLVSAGAVRLVRSEPEPIYALPVAGSRSRVHHRA
jgi:hypothetical protein